jgi:hypothetical protein
LKQLIVVVLSLLSTSAWAEWTPVGVNDADTFVIYADMATIGKAGNMVKMWSLIDYKTARRSSTEQVYLSEKSQREYDCLGERLRILYFSWHSGNMGSEEIVYSNAYPRRWEPVPPGSIGEFLWKTACKQ